MRIETKRKWRQRKTNTWYIEFLGTDAGNPLQHQRAEDVCGRYQRFAESRLVFVSISDLSPLSPLLLARFSKPVFNDCFQQMWAAFSSGKRDGQLGDRFGCVTPRKEALLSHRLFNAALKKPRGQIRCDPGSMSSNALHPQSPCSRLFRISLLTTRRLLTQRSGILAAGKLDCRSRKS